MIRTFLSTPVGDAEEVTISGEELRYLSRVRRLAAGDEVEIRDSAGKSFLAVLRVVGRKEGILGIVRPLESRRDTWPVSLVVAVPKRSLMEDVVRHASELGAEVVRPIVTARSSVRPGEGKIERWRRVAAESVRQCGRCEPLDVAPAVSFEEALSQEATRDNRFILSPEGDGGGLGEIPARGLSGSAVMVIGPEGGFTEEELATARGSGYEAVRAGDLVLRVETAAVTACVVALAAMGGLGVKT